MGCRLRQPGHPMPASVEPPRAHRADFAAAIGEGRLVTLYDQASWSEGPVWWARESSLVWSDVVGRRVLAWREDGAVDVLIDATPFTNGNAVAADGALLHCEHGRRAISRTGPDGTTRVIATHAGGSRLNAPNDLVVASDGAVWFTDPTFGIENPRQGCPAPSESGATAVCRLAPGSCEAARMVEMAQPNGLAFSPDGHVLYVSQTPEDGSGEVAIFAFDHGPSGLSGRRRFASMRQGAPDGFCVDRRGWLWSSSALGLEIFDPDGTRIGEVRTPHLCSNCAFDLGERRLFVTGRESLWMLPLG